ncbi:MAG: HD domain-containing protein, partial [Alphaproteobacteria bacterium]
ALKALKRRGWINRGCSHTESDADHSWGVVFLAYLYAPQELDITKCLKLALIHDLAEISIGDIIPSDSINKNEKHLKEENAMIQLSNDLQLTELISLFSEFESASTPEAIFVRDLDKLDMAMQCRYFIEQGQLQESAWHEFIPSARPHIQTPLVKEIFEKLCAGYQGKKR